MTDAPVLTVERLGKSYGGIVANRDVSLTVRPGEVHGLIGPNGAGKTTLIALLAGEVRPDRGRILLGGTDITALPAPARARLGISRSFQVSSVFGDFTVQQNLMLACSVAGGLRAWRPVGRDAALRDRAQAALDRVGIRHLAPRSAASLSHGERRQVELAMVLAGDPVLLLLDEPFAGLGRDETQQMVAILAALRGAQAMLLIEHDLAAVFSLADRLTVLVMGTPIATGPSDAVRADPRVQAAYLGEA
jgi:branched-chain amino acid transport system ATP-binding protein